MVASRALGAVCAREADPAASCGRSTSSLGDADGATQSRHLVGCDCDVQCGVGGSNSSTVRAIDELHECLRDVASHTPASAQPAYVSPCRMRDVSILVGVSRSDLLGALGQPGFCTGPKNQIALWSDPMCRAPVGFGYSFYRLCEDCVGGGPELLIQFDSAGATSLLRWVATQ